MNSVLLGSGRVDLVSPFVGFSGHAEKLFRNAIGKSAQCFGNNFGFFASNGKVDDIVVNGVIADKSACVGKFFHFWRKTERFNFCCQIAAFCFCGVHHALNANSQHCAGRSWRNSGNGLGFGERLFGVIRHAIDRGDPAVLWVHKPASSPERQFSAVRAALHAVFVWIHEVEEVAGFVLNEAAQRTASHKQRSLIGQRDHVFFKLADYTAVGATK